MIRFSEGKFSMLLYGRGCKQKKDSFFRWFPLILSNQTPAKKEESDKTANPIHLMFGPLTDRF